MYKRQALALTVGAVMLQRLSRSRRRLRSRLTAAQSRLDELRGRDPVTGLVTRAEFELVLDEAVLECDRSGSMLALMHVDLDGFGTLNDAYGPHVGDALLAQAARRMSALVGEGPTVARLGGDGFVLLVPGPLDEADRTADALQQSLQQPFQVDDLALRLTASIGIAMYPDHGARPRLLSHAALAMRAVKHGGGAGRTHFVPAMGVDLRDQADLLQDLRLALERGELQLVYQPKIDARSMQVTAAEALLRWQHPRRGMVSTAVFIPMAERHGLIVPIGLWVIEEACRQAGQWRESGLRMRVAVNISGLQLRRDDLVPQIEAALKRHRIPAGRFTCEITESLAIEDTPQMRQAFERLHGAGLHIAIDDFGSEQSNLALLGQLTTAAELKFSNVFVATLAGSSRTREIARAIIRLAHELDMRVVAEGVETAAQRDVLMSLGCDEMQGYFFYRPMTARAMALSAMGNTEGSCDQGTHPPFSASLFDPTAPAELPK